MANICLRQVPHCDPVWVACLKEVPNVVLVTPWLIVYAARGNRVMPPRRVLMSLVGASLVCHVGNMVFLWSLFQIGIAMTVPLVLGTMITAGAVLSWIFLKERVNSRAIVSISVLLVAILVLSLGARQAHQSVAAQTMQAEAAGAWDFLGGVAGAILAGAAYSVLGVAIRSSSGRSPLPTTIVTVGLVGVLALGSLALYRLGTEGMASTDPADLKLILLAGVINTVSFIALTKALHLVSVVFVNALNASQAAMAALAGVFLFHETSSWALRLGIALMIAGLVLMKSREGEMVATVEP